MAPAASTAGLVGSRARVWARLGAPWAARAVASLGSAVSGEPVMVPVPSVAGDSTRLPAAATVADVEAWLGPAAVAAGRSEATSFGPTESATMARTRLTEAVRPATES